ncbi:MAG TPA: 4-alpha-glucanotransferase [Sandaracinaceae bacterium LLY-WYZ-13_1]|nr:4-alpha-glucanotransferase [Sandaracinaceae bacterium LLY-WYZ-13_1]
MTQRRLAGVMIPLFSLRSRFDWGVGELPDFARFAPLLERGGFRVLMTLPLLEPSPGQESPYSPVSAFALDPLYVSLDDVPEMEALGGREALGVEDRGWLRAARGAMAVRHDIVRPLKKRWLERCFARFSEAADGARARDFEAFREAEAHWLGDYALFRTLKEHYPQSWRAWPEPLRQRDEAALAEARSTHADEIALREYVQWVAFRQLEKARADLARSGIHLGGDEPFLVADDSADVWANQEDYRFDATVGAPPDAFSETGQDWGLPPYRWDRIAANDFELFRRRGRQAAKLFDLVRIDHVVGFYRTYHRPLDGTEHYFVPSEEPAQRAQGEAVLNAFAEAGAALIAEDLGVIPDFVRESLQRLEIPGFRVLRWEEREGRFRLPGQWPALSVATNGTHDTETSAAWWEQLPDHQRAAIREIPQLGRLPEDLTRSYNHHVHRALLEALYESPSRLVLLPIQDLFGLRERINVPNTVGPQNWSWRLPWSIDTMDREDHVGGQLDDLATLARRSDRLGS